MLGLIIFIILSQTLSEAQDSSLTTPISNAYCVINSGGCNDTSNLNACQCNTDCNNAFGNSVRKCKIVCNLIIIYRDIYCFIVFGIMLSIYY